MTERIDFCPHDDRLVELALGELTGRDRADALQHLSTCRGCRERVDELVQVSEELLLAAPEAEPPLGFESVVMRKLAGGSRARRRRLRFPAIVGLACAAAIVLVVGVVGPLTSRGSSEIAEAAMITSDGQQVGSAWRYDGDTSWVLVSVPDWAVWADPANAPKDYELHLELDDGTAVGLGAITFRGDARSWGRTTTVDTARIRSVAIVDHTGRIWCSATFQS